MCCFDPKIKSALITYFYFEGESSSEFIHFRVLDGCFAFNAGIISCLVGAYIATFGFPSAAFVEALFHNLVSVGVSW